MGVRQYDVDEDGRRAADLAEYEYYVYEQSLRADPSAAAADSAIAICTHESGTRSQAYDSDGCGYYVWRCDGCGFQAIDTMS